jgi:nitrogen-specific signal transduction histidine kinase
MLRLLQRTLGEHIEIVTQLGPGLDAVFADPGQAEQVIVNLALNARDAMPGGGRLTIETSTPRWTRPRCSASSAASCAPAGTPPPEDPGPKPIGVTSLRM